MKKHRAMNRRPIKQVTIRMKKILAKIMIALQLMSVNQNTLATLTHGSTSNQSKRNQSRL